MKLLIPIREFIRENQILFGTLLRFLMAGTIGAITNVGGLFIFTEYVGLHYLVSASISFLIACGVGFSLQKFWTFRERSVEKIHAQAIGFFIISGINFFLNIAALYFLVEKIHIWYILAQIIVSGLIAISSFLLYKNVIFLVKR